MFEKVRLGTGRLINNRYIQFFMVIVALYALTGNEIRKLAFGKKDDAAF